MKLFLNPTLETLRVGVSTDVLDKAVIQTLELLIRFGFIRSFQLLGRFIVGCREDGHVVSL